MVCHILAFPLQNTFLMDCDSFRESATVFCEQRQWQSSCFPLRKFQIEVVATPDIDFLMEALIASVSHKIELDGLGFE